MQSGNFRFGANFNFCSVVDEEPNLAVSLHWSKPSQTYGELVGYRIIYGAKEMNTSNEILKTASERTHKFSDLGKKFL